MTEKQPIEILLVEDNPNDIELEMRAFKKHNLDNKVFVVKDGAEALDYLFATGVYHGREPSESPKLILLDLKLPKVDGLEVLEKIKADERTKAIPVVVLTSSKEEWDLVKSYELGVNSYITKPIEFDQFIRVAAELGLENLQDGLEGPLTAGQAKLIAQSIRNAKRLGKMIDDLLDFSRLHDDPDLIAQVVTNLVSNAVRYAREKSW